MNLSKINIKQLENILSVMPANQNIMLVGKHGIGKSEILTHLDNSEHDHPVSRPKSQCFFRSMTTQKRC